MVSSVLFAPAATAHRAEAHSAAATAATRASPLFIVVLSSCPWGCERRNRAPPSHRRGLRRGCRTVTEWLRRQPELAARSVVEEPCRQARDEDEGDQHERGR